MVNKKTLTRFLPLGFFLTLAFILRLPSLFEPASYGDEGVYQVLGQAVRNGGLLYRDIWDNKPPLLYLLYAPFNGDLFSARFLSLLFALLTIVIFYFLARQVFQNSQKFAHLSTFAFTLLFSLPLLEGNIANAENFMLLPVILAMYLVLKFSQKKPQSRQFFIPGFLLGLAFLFKIVAIFDLFAIIVFLSLLNWARKKNLGFLSFLLLGFAFPVLSVTFFFFSKGALGEFFRATFASNIGYVAYGNQLFIPQGWLFLKTLLLGLFCLFLFRQRQKLPKVQLFIFVWLAFSLFNALFAQRPYTHYLLVILPSFCLLLLLTLAKKNFRFLAIGALILVIYLAFSQFWLYGKTLPYYENFFSFILGRKTTSAYFSFWGDHVNRDYQVSQFLSLKTAPQEPVFVWGNNPQIYALAKRPVAGRFTVAYHILSYPWAMGETYRVLTQHPPRYFVILQPQTDPLRDLEAVLHKNYHLFFQSEGFTVYERGI